MSETEHDKEYALSLAPVGARCRVEGFADWRATEYGWQNEETGQLVSNGYLADLLNESERIGL